MTNYMLQVTIHKYVAQSFSHGLHGSSRIFLMSHLSVPHMGSGLSQRGFGLAMLRKVEKS